jgi:hypothetical protein
MEKRICSFRDQAVVGMVEDILRKRGIHPRPVNTSGHVFVAGAGQTYDVWVPAEEEDEARQVLAAEGYEADLTKK